MLQGRLFAYGDAHRYRLGINHTQLPVNAPHATEAHNYGRDGLMAGHGNGGRAKNYEPNSFDGPVETDQPYAAPLELARRHRDLRVGLPGHRRLHPGRRPLPPAAGRRPGPAGRQHRRRARRRCRPVRSGTGSSSGASPTSGPPTPSSGSGSPRA